MGLLGDTSDRAIPTSTGYSATAIWGGNVPALFDRGLLDMVASDPQKGIWEPGAYIGQLPNGTEFGNTVGGTPDLKVAYDDTDPPVAVTLAPETGDHYIFTPLNSWKYMPSAVSMTFQHRLRRTFYNPTNLVMTVYVTELRRKRRQLECDLTSQIPTTARSDWELLDLQPWGEIPRIGYFNSSGTGWMCYAPETARDSASIITVLRAGEYYRRFLYIRFGQYEQQQYQSRGLTNVAARLSGTTGPGFAVLGQWDPRMSYNPTGTEVTDPANPAAAGYSFSQNIRDPVTTGTISGLQVGIGLDPWNSLTTGGATSSTLQEWEYDSTFNPLRNPFLKKLFYMKRTRYVIPPGGSAQHIFRTGGRVNPIRSNIMRYMQFYSDTGAYDYKTEADREVPYGLPFDHAVQPPPVCHSTRKQGGFYDVSAIIQVKGQMQFLKTEEAKTSEVLQYSATRVVAHDSHHISFKVCSYGRPLTGGRSVHTTFLAQSNTGSDYYSNNPTAAPAAVAPSLNSS